MTAPAGGRGIVETRHASMYDRRAGFASLPSDEQALLSPRECTVPALVLAIDLYRGSSAMSGVVHEVVGAWRR